MALEHGPENIENENPEIRQAEAEKQEQHKIEHAENADAVEANATIKNDVGSEADGDSAEDKQDEFFFSEDSPYARFAENADSGIIAGDADNTVEDKQDEFSFSEDSPYARFAESADSGVIADDTDEQQADALRENSEHEALGDSGDIAEDLDDLDSTDGQMDEDDPNAQLEDDAENGTIKDDPDGDAADSVNPPEAEANDAIGQIKDDPDDIVESANGNETEPIEQPKADEDTESVEQPKADEDTESVEQPKADEDAEPVEQPKTDEDTESVEQPKADEDAESIEQPKADEDTESVEQPKADEDTESVEQPKADEDAESVEQPKADEDTESVEQPKADEDAEPVEQPKADEDAESVEQPKADEDAESIEQPKADEDTESVEQPKGDEDTESVEQPKTDEDTESVEQPKADEDAEPVEQPKADEDTESVEQPKADEDAESIEQPKADEDTESVEQPKADENVETGDQPKNDEADSKPEDSNDTTSEDTEVSRDREKTKYEQLTNEEKAELLQTQSGREKLNAMYDDMIERKEAKDKGMSVEDYRKFKSGQLDKEYGTVASVYNKATELNSSPELQITLFTADYEATASELKGRLKEDLKAIEDKMAKFEGKPMEMGEYPEWKKLNSEKEKREEQISDIDKILAKAKDVERNNAFELSTERYNAIRGDSKKERREDLKRDQACVRNNIAAARGIRQDIVDTKKEADKIEAKLTDIVNTYSLDDMRTDPRLSGVYKEFKELNHQYGELRDKQETYEKQLNRLDDLNKKLSEIHGVDKEGRPVLEIPDLRKEVDDRSVYDAIKAVNESSQGTLLKDKLEAKDCVDALSAIDNAERVVMPALAEQISGLDQQLSAIDSYLANNPPDAYFSNLKEKLGKEYAEKFTQLGELVEGTTRLKTHMEVSDLKHSAKCIINADGTYSLQQRWTNVKEKISDNGSFKNTRQLYSNAYDRVSNCKFDEKGRVLSEDFSFKYKLLGYFSERKFGGEKLNLHNVFETGLLNVKAKGGWDQEKGFNIEGGASVFEIKDAATLNMLNKQVMQLNTNLSFMEAKGKAEFDREKAQMNASFSVNDGWSGGADMSVGKVKLLETAFSSWTNSISGKFDLAKAVDRKLEGIKVSDDATNKFSYSIGDQIRMFEYENKNGVVENKVFVSDITDLLSEDIGFSDIKDVYDSYTEQKESFDDIFEKGIAKDEVSSKEKVAFQTKQHADENSKFSRAARDAKDLGERSLNGATSSDQPAWIKEADVLKAMDKTFLSLDDQKLVSETIDKIQKGEALSKDDADQLEYIHFMLAKNDYGAEACAVSHLYSKTDIALKDETDNIFTGLNAEPKPLERIKTSADGKNHINIAESHGEPKWVSQDDINRACKKCYLGSADIAMVGDAIEKTKNGNELSTGDKEYLSDIVDALLDGGFTKESYAVSKLTETERPKSDVDEKLQQAMDFVDERCRSFTYPDAGPDVLTKSEESIITTQLDKMFKSCDFCSRVQSNNLIDIVRSGGVHSQTENTGTSNGTFAPELRKNFSVQQYGCEANEKYGYACSFADELNGSREGSINNYGDIIINFKKASIDGKMTYFMGDSLAANKHGMDSHLGVVGSNNRKTTLCGSMNLTNQEILEVAKSGSVNPYDYVGERNYLEVQFLGSLGVNDISSIGFLHPADYENLPADVKDILRANNIEVVFPKHT